MASYARRVRRGELRKEEGNNRSKTNSRGANSRVFKTQAILLENGVVKTIKHRVI